MRSATLVAAFLAAGCPNYVLDINFGIDQVRDGNAVCPQLSDNLVGGIVSVSFDGTTWNNYLTGLTFGPVLRVSLDAIGSGTAAPTFPIAAPAVELCAPITVASDGTTSISALFNDTFTMPLPVGATAGDLYVTAAIYDIAINTTGGASTCDPSGGPVLPLSGINLTSRLDLDSCERRLVEIPLTADASTWDFGIPGTPAPGEFWDANDYEYDYSATMRTVWPPPTGDPVLGPPPAGPVTPPNPGAPLPGNTVNITVIAEGYDATDIATRFWNDVSSAVTQGLGTKWLYLSSSVRNNITVRAIPSESFVSFEGNETVARAWRIFNSQLDTNTGQLAWDMNFLRMNRVAGASGAPTDYYVMLLNDANCHGYAWPKGHDNGIIGALGREGWNYVARSCGGVTATHELGHSIGIVQDERDVGGHSWFGPNVATCGALFFELTIGLFTFPMVPGTWLQYGLTVGNCATPTVLVDNTCHVAGFSVGSTHGIVAGGENVMFPENSCGMSFNGGTEFCRVCNQSMLASLRGLVGAAADFATIQTEVLGQFPISAPFPTGLPVLTCP